MTNPAWFLALRLALPMALVVVLGACAADRDAGSATDEPTAFLLATPTPEPTETGTPRVSATAEARCERDGETTSIVIRYAARAEGSTRLSRVRLTVDGKLAEDSGELSQKEYVRIATVQGSPGRHTFVLTAEAPGARPSPVSGLVICATPPRPTQAPQA